MWILPAELGTIALPDGVLLLPHHYVAEDRERLLALLRVALPGSRQLVVEGAALGGLIERGVRWEGGLVLIHGLPADTDVDGLRGLVAPLGAKHVLVQLPKAQLVGTSWMEPTLKVPLLRALEREWRDPAHPLRGIGIHECPLREAAQYTDEPVELMAIVTAMVEHRMAHASVGVGKGDWERSLDQSLTARLRLRLRRTRGDLIGWSVGTARAFRDEAESWVAAGLGFIDDGQFRRSPIITSLERSAVRVRFSSVDAARKAPHGEEQQRATELFHFAAELWPMSVALFPPLGSRKVKLRAAVIKEDGLQRHFRFAHLLLDMSGSQRDWVSSSISSIGREVEAATGRGRGDLLAMHAFLRGMSSQGPTALREIESCLDTMIRSHGRTQWRHEVEATLALLWTLRAWIQRGSLRDAQGAHGRVAGLLRSGVRVGAWIEGVKGKVAEQLSCALENRPAGDVLSLVGSGASYTDEMRLPGWVEPSYEDVRGIYALRLAWVDLWRSNLSRAIRVTARLDDPGEVPITVEHLHGYLTGGVAALAVSDLDTASQRAHQVLDLATRYEIPMLRAFARELLAAVHELRGEYDVAAKLLFQARSRYIALEDRSRILGVEKRLARMGITYDPFGSPRRKRAPRSS